MAAKEMAHGWDEQSVFHRLSHDSFSLFFPEARVGLTAEEVHTHKAETKAKVIVFCNEESVQTYGGLVSTTMVNLTSELARTRLANATHKRVNLDGYPWGAIIDEFAIRVMEEAGKCRPSTELDDGVYDDESTAFVDVLGATLPFSLPSILFGDGGSFKSYLALLWAIEIAEQGHTVAYFDWEMNKRVHASRAKLLRAAGLTGKVRYLKPDAPLVQSATALRKEIVKHGISYAVIDSIGFAADGPIEESVTANRYFQAVSKLGIGTLHLAHVSKDQLNKEAPRVPFGSSFWHNQARSTWHLSAEQQDENYAHLTLSQRKNNLGRLRESMPIGVQFGHEQTTITVVKGF
jgi:hypothetical protein